MHKIKVAHIFSGPLSGGAARGALWLHSALLESNIDSWIFINTDDSLNITNSIDVSGSRIERLSSKLIRKLSFFVLLFYPLKERTKFSLGLTGHSFLDLPQFKDADIVHLHWINDVLSINAISQIRKPIVWTVRDMWPFTGGCHYSFACNRYLLECGRCNHLHSHWPLDISYFIYRLKKKYYPKLIFVVGLSKWITNTARNSSLFSACPSVTIPNCIDTKLFSPTPHPTLKEKLKLAPETKIVLAGSINNADYYKGSDLLFKALSLLSDYDQNIVLVTFGSNLNQAPMSELKLRKINLGYVSRDEILVEAYSSSHVFVCPSRMESFGKTIIESFACGTPVVCFDATGPSDIVDHKENGYRATPYDPRDLMNGIKWVLNHDQKEYNKLSKNARLKAVTRYDSSVVASQYIDLYKQILTN